MSKTNTFYFSIFIIWSEWLDQMTEFNMLQIKRKSSTMMRQQRRYRTEQHITS